MWTRALKPVTSALALALAVACSQATLAIAQDRSCTRDAFESVVDEASAVLVDMTQKNTPTFQAKLRDLKTKKGWTDQQFLEEGAQFVQDATISGFDDKSKALLMRINSQNTETADCKLLDDLKAAMTELVETQNAKWSYMFGKITKALAD